MTLTCSIPVKTYRWTAQCGINGIGQIVYMVSSEYWHCKKQSCKKCICYIWIESSMYWLALLCIACTALWSCLILLIVLKCGVIITKPASNHCLFYRKELFKKSIWRDRPSRAFATRRNARWRPDTTRPSRWLRSRSVGIRGGLKPIFSLTQRIPLSTRRPRSSRLPVSHGYAGWDARNTACGRPVAVPCT